jgi:hypothetical protein
MEVVQEFGIWLDRVVRRQIHDGRALDLMAAGTG